MPDDARTAPAEGFGGLTPWLVFLDKYLPLPDGRSRSERSARHVAQRYGFQLIRVGNHKFVDEVYEAQRLREATLMDRMPRRPGRPPRR